MRIVKRLLSTPSSPAPIKCCWNCTTEERYKHLMDINPPREWSTLRGVSRVEESPDES